MDKSPEAFRTISEVAEALDVPPHVLRFWETRFAQVKPVKRGGGRRYYRPEDVQLLRGIRGLLYGDGMTIKGVQKILRERGVRHVIGLGSVEPDTARAAPKAREAQPGTPDLATRRDAAGRSVQTEKAPAAKAEPAPSHADLFALAEEAAAFEHAPAAGPVRPMDRAALRDLVRQLEALRVVMAADVEA